MESESKVKCYFILGFKRLWYRIEDDVETIICEDEKNATLVTKEKYEQLKKLHNDLLFEKDPDRLVKCYHLSGHSEWWYRKNPDGSADFYGTEENTTPIPYREAKEMSIYWHPLIIIET